jgi:cytochrome o ubiquinol oxidase subunit IV
MNTAVKAYITGFLVCIVCTLASWYVATPSLSGSILSKRFTVLIIVSLAVLQFFLQLFYFLRLRTSKDRLQVMLLSFALIVICIIVGGSLWIMHNLNTNMAKQPTDSYLIKDEGLQRQ